MRYRCECAEPTGIAVDCSRAISAAITFRNACWQSPCHRNSSNGGNGALIRFLVLLSLMMINAPFVSGSERPKLWFQIKTPMAAPEWARLERQIFADSLPAARQFAEKYYDERGHFQAFLRWGANDGPDDAFENFAGWPEFYALGANEEILQIFLRTWEGMLQQFTETKTNDVPIARSGMYYRDFCVQSDWMHLGEGLRTFNAIGLAVPTLPIYLARARRFAGFYMGEDREAPNYDSKRKLIRSLINGSKGPMLRHATALDWAGDPFDVSKFVARHGEHSYAQFLQHYKEYTNVVGDHFLNLVATILPLDAYVLTNETKYKKWIIEYMNAWLERMKQNGGVIPSYISLDGTIGGHRQRWWGGTYGWGFSPINPVTGFRENRNRIDRSLVGFNNALLVSGDQRYVDAWRTMINSVNSHARMIGGEREYPTMYGVDGWYGWRQQPWNVGALQIWYWSMRADDRARVGSDPWLNFLDGMNPRYPETALRGELASISQRVAAMRRDSLTAETRLSDNAMEYNPIDPAALIQLMWGGLPPGRAGGPLNARLRYFDPVARRAGLPEDVAALVSELKDSYTEVTLVNLSPTESRSVTVQAGGYAEHQFISVETEGHSMPLNARAFTVRIAPGAGATLGLMMKRYVNQPTVLFPWSRKSDVRG